VETFVVIEGNPNTKTMTVYGPFSTRDAAKDYIYTMMMVPKYAKILPLCDPLFEEMEQPEFA
jgi:hypothetical protein